MMDREETRQFIKKINAIQLVKFLAQLGHEPTKIRGEDYWYRSPLRDEKTASFKVDNIKNCWFDHGTGEGGNLMDFAIRYHGCTVGEFLAMVRQNDYLQHVPQTEPVRCAEPQTKIEVVQDKALFSYPLLKYLRERHIDREIADLFCREVTFRIGEKEYYGIGFKNNSGGWEIRNPYMKCACNPKDITTISNGSRIANVFEGFFDFLSHMTLVRGQALARQDFVITNGLGLIKHTFPFLEAHERGHLFLDNGRGGDQATAIVRKNYPDFQDLRHLYRQYGDYNDWLRDFGKHPQQKKNIRI
jgi:hypothetical protein